MRRPARLQSARAWLESGGEATVRAYARRYGVDRYTAHDELGMLGVTLRAKDTQGAQRPPSVPTSATPPARGKSRGEQVWPDDELLEDWIEWGDELVFVAGFTSGGAPYGVRLEDFPPEDLPEELEEAAAARRTEQARMSAVQAELRARRGEDGADVWDLPF